MLGLSRGINSAWASKGYFSVLYITTKQLLQTLGLYCVHILSQTYLTFSGTDGITLLCESVLCQGIETEERLLDAHTELIPHGLGSQVSVGLFIE